jgi:mannose-6-phosphate isomerase
LLNPGAAKSGSLIKGKRLSLQYHERKTETLYLVSGKVRLTYRELQPSEKHESAPINEKNEFIWEPGLIVHIPVRTIHRFEAIEDSVLLEASTPDLTDVVRLQDDYARPSRD